MGKTINIAAIGLGEVAHAHLQAQGKLEGATISTLVEPVEARRVQISEKLNIPAFQSIKEMLDHHRPDAACILTPASTHKDIALELMDEGIHVMCEKPLAISLEDGLAIQKACATSDTVFQYASSYRFLPAVQKAREIVQSGQLGDIRLITEQLVTGAGLEGFRAAGFVHYPKGGPGGGMMGLCDHGVHFLDIIPWIVGSPIAKVSGLGNISGEAPTPETAMLRLKNGALGILTYDEATYSSDLPYEGIFSGGQDWITGEGFGGHIGEWAAGAPSFRIHGSKGALRVFHYGYKLFIHDQDGLREIALPTAAEANHFFYQMQAFVDTIQGKREVPAGIDEGLAGVRALLALYESQSKEAWISL